MNEEQPMGEEKGAMKRGGEGQEMECSEHIGQRKADCGCYEREAAAAPAMKRDQLPNFEQEYNKVMSLLRNTKMPHGLCEPRERKACTHCNAVETLDKLIAEYKGARVTCR